MAATKLAFTTQPAGYTSEGVLTTQPVVTAQNSDNSTDTSFTGLVVLTPDKASSRFYTTTELLATTRTVQAGSTASTILVSPALSFPTTLPPTYDGQQYYCFISALNGSTWSAVTAYNVGDFVISGGVNSYRCIQANTNQTPPNATYWVLDAVQYQRRTLSGNTGTGQIDLASTLSAAPSAGVTVAVHSGVTPPAVAATCVAGVATFSGLSLAGWEATALVASSSGLTSATSNTMSPTGTRDGPAELPRVTVDTSAPTIDGVTVTVGPTGADYTTVQAAVNARATANSNANDAIVLQAGASFAENVILKKKASGTGWIVITGHTDPCAEGTRITPALAAAANLAKVIATGGSMAFACDAGAHHYRLQGFEVTHTADSNGLVNFTDRDSENNGTGLLADMPHHIIVDRLYAHDDGTHNVKYAVKLNCGTAGVVDSYLTAIDRNNDCQAIVDFAGAGPYRIHNNHCEASSENLLFGGADPYVAGSVTSDATITNNYFFKPLAWISDPLITGKVKNLVEFKSLRRFRFEGNVLENNWAGGQTGSGILFTPVNQSATAPNAGVRDGTFRNNVLRNSSSGYNVTQENSERGVTSMGLWRVAIHDTVLWNINDPAEVQADSRLMSLFDGCYDVWITHNTLLGSVNAAGTRALVFDQPDNPASRSRYDNNLTTAQGGAVLASGDTPGGPSINHCLLNADGTFSNNALIDFNSDNGGTGYPASTLFPATNAAAGFADASITATWDTDPFDDVLAALAITSAGTPDLRTAATDGTPVGANISAVRTAITGVVAGTPGEDTQTADHLALSVQPSGAVSGVPLVGQPVVLIEDATDATVTGDTSTVTASVQTGAGVTITAGSTKAAVAGIASFAGLTLSAASTVAGVVLRFSDGALTTVDSGPFTLTVPAVSDPAPPSVLPGITDQFRPPPRRIGLRVVVSPSPLIGTGGLVAVASNTVSVHIPVGRVQVSVLSLALDGMVAAAGSGAITIQVSKVTPLGTVSPLTSAVSIKSDVVTAAGNLAFPMLAAVFDGAANGSRRIDGQSGDILRVDITAVGTVTTQPQLRVVAELAVNG